MKEEPTSSQEEQEELKQIFPFVKSWRQLYILVLTELAVLIVLFYIFSKIYS